MNNSITGTAFIQEISEKALRSNAVNHPYLDALREGELPNIDLAWQDFAYQYGFYSSQFVQYVSVVIQNLKHQHHKDILLENLAEENGGTHDVDLPDDVLASVEGQPHTHLFRRFQESLGVDVQYRNTVHESHAALSWREEFLKLCSTNEYVGVGAVGIGTELLVPKIYHQILEGLKTHSNLSLEQRVFFDLHSECDDEHAAQLQQIAEELAVDQLSCEKIEYGVDMAISMRTKFWDEMLERAQNLQAIPSKAAS